MGMGAARRSSGGSSGRRCRRPLPGGARSVVLAAALAVAGCTSIPAKVALTGDLPALKASIAQAEKQEKLGASGLRELAGAVLERELWSLAPADVFPDVEPCAKQIRSVLSDVAGSSSEFATVAALALFDAGYSPSGDPADPVARDAVEAREAVGPEAGDRRRALMLHGDAAVRRAALSAALEGADPLDIPPLAEAGRLDPDAEARAIAVLALGRIGGERAVQSLVDLYASADRATRRVILLSWSEPRSFAVGGRAMLEDLALDTSEASVLAASALLRADAGENDLVSAALGRGIESRVKAVRLLALYVTPWSLSGTQAALAAARKHADPATRVLALLRSVEAGALDAEGNAELGRLATDDATIVGAVARAALARAGNGAVKPALRADLVAPRSERRTLAALSLLSLEDWAGAAHALGDDSPSVRRAVACQVLAGPTANARTAFPALRPPAFGPAAPELVPLLLGGASG
jgi:hypothetical protein